MSIAQGDLENYLSANHPTSDTETSGGAVDTSKTLLDGQIPDGSPEDLDVVSTDAGDTMDVTVHYRDTAGSVQSATATLNGTAAVTAILGESAERILRIILASAPAGDVTVDGNSSATTYHTFPGGGGETEAHIHFQLSKSESSQTTRYEKEFWQNGVGDGTALTNASVTLTADPGSNIQMAVEDAIDDNESVANRETQPSGITADGFVDDGVAVSVPGGGDLPDGSSIGIWAELTRPADASAVRSSFTTEIAGETV